MTCGAPLLCRHCGRPIVSLNLNDRIVWVGGSSYHYACTQPPANPEPQVFRSPQSGHWPYV